MNWNKDLFKKMVTLAVRAPSVHNVQPWKVQFTDQGFNLFQSTKRRLFIGDPLLHDNDVSLGCFLEVCRIFLKDKGLDFELVKNESTKIESTGDVYEMRFSLNLFSITPVKDYLYDYILKRRSYRGIFDYDKNYNDEKLKEINVENIGLKWITEPLEVKKWAAIYDDSSAHVNKIPGYFRELVNWIRFSEKHKNFHQDGLNSEALALKKWEGVLAGLFFNETVFKALSVLSLEKLLITEAPQILSSQGIMVIYANKNISSLEMGMGFVRFWLELTSKGLYATPLSALVDFTRSRDILNGMAPADDMICLNVLRFGKVNNESKIYSSPRLDTNRVILE